MSLETPNAQLWGYQLRRIHVWCCGPLRECRTWEQKESRLRPGSSSLDGQGLLRGALVFVSSLLRGENLSKFCLLSFLPTCLRLQATIEGETGMTNNKKSCVVFIHENGDTRRRWVQEITWHVRGRAERRLTGDRLPRSLSLRLGADQSAYSVLELFDDNSSKQIPHERPPWPNGRDAINGVVAIVGFHFALALLDAVARAM